MTQFLQRVLITAMIIFGVWIAAFFGLRTFHAYKEVRQHRPPPPFKNETPESDVQLIEDWMTIPFIGKTYHVPPTVIFDALNIPSEGNHEKSLKQLNEKYYPDKPGYILKLVKNTVQTNLHPPVSPLITAVPGIAP